MDLNYLPPIVERTFMVATRLFYNYLVLNLFILFLFFEYEKFRQKNFCFKNHFPVLLFFFGRLKFLK